MPDSNQQHLDEILQNKKAWNNKPILREEYFRFYRKVQSHLTRHASGERPVIVEIGSGMGQIKSVIENVILTDLFPNPWIDRVCSAYQLPWEDSAVDDLILIDVFHHLEKPLAFINEARRILKCGGRIHILDPYISLTSWPVYHFGHHEPIGRAADIQWDPHPPAQPAYYAAQGNATHIFFRNAIESGHIPLKVSFQERWSCWSYLLSGGFSKPAMYPGILYKTIQLMDRLLSGFPDLFAGRCYVVLEKE